MSRLHRQTNQRLGKDRVLKVERKIVINKSQFAKYFADRYGVTYADAKIWVYALVESMADAVNENKRLQLEGFGSFVKKRYDARTYNNPRKSERTPLPERYKLKFIPGKTLKTTFTVKEMERLMRGKEADDGEED